MTRSEKDAALNDLASKIFNAMLGEVIMDTTLQVHKESLRSRATCEVCGTRCGQTHTGPLSTTGASQEATQTSTQETTDKPNGNINLECVNCQRQFASNRFAQHLATCLGVGTGVRRTVQRNVVTKMQANGRSGSPYVEIPLESPETKTTKSKAKSKPKQEDEQNANQKRPGTPNVSPAKKQKKGKVNPAPPVGTGPPRLPGSQHRLAPPLSKPGSSKLRSTPTPSVASHSSLPSLSKKSHSRSRSPSQRSDSSEDSHYNSRSNASSVGSRAGFSPTLPSAESIGRNANRNKAATGKVTGTGPPIKRAPPTLPRIPSPPRTVPPPAPAPVPQRRAVDTSTYFVDIEGDETGSSSDTDSS